MGRDLGARLVWIPSGTLKTTFPATGSCCLSRDISKYLVAGNSKSANGVTVVHEFNLVSVLKKGIEVQKYKITLNSKDIVVVQVKYMDQDQLLLPEWLMSQSKKMVWKVVKINDNGHWNTRLVYIGITLV